MAYRVEWSPKAIEDLDTIAAYIAEDSISYAASVVRKIRDTTRILHQFPKSGREVPEFNDPLIREKFAYSYRIIYRVAGSTIIIAAVIHGNRFMEIELVE